MQHNSDRYINSGESLWCYADRVLCHCPKCERQAIVSKDRIYCLSCTYQEKKYEGKLHGNVLGTPRSWSPHCSTCGYRLFGIRLKAKAIGSQLPKTKSVTCPACKQQTKIDLQWNIDRHSSNAIDPSFGCELWLQIPCCGNILWAYNERHLSDLKSYIGSNLRDGRNRRGGSMISRLPRWMVIAKNRDAVLKCIDKLEDRIALISN
jgi:hypothetical protein